MRGPRHYGMQCRSMEAACNCPGVSEPTRRGLERNRSALGSARPLGGPTPPRGPTRRWPWSRLPCHWQDGSGHLAARLRGRCRTRLPLRPRIAASAPAGPDDRCCRSWALSPGPMKPPPSACRDVAFGTSPQGACRPWPGLRDSPVGSASRVREGPRAAPSASSMRDGSGRSSWAFSTARPTSTRRRPSTAASPETRTDRLISRKTDGRKRDQYGRTIGTASRTAAAATGRERPTGRAT